MPGFPTFSLLKKKSAVVEDPELEDVLENKLPEPFSLENFRGYLTSQLAVENLDFCLSVMNLKEKFSQGTAENEFQDILETHEEIVSRFVHTSAQDQINISGDLRRDTLKRVKHSTQTKTWTADIFDEAFREIKLLLEAEPFFEFVKQGKQQNLTKPISDYRFKSGIALITFGILTTMALVVLSVFADEVGSEVVENPLLRLSSILMYGPGFFFLLSGYYKMCPWLWQQRGYANAHCGKKHQVDQVFSGKTECNLKHTVASECARKSLGRISRKIIFQVLFFSLLLTGVGVAVPPSSFYE